MEALFFLANVLFCLAYAVRNIMWLRTLTITASLCVLPYFYFRTEPLYSVLFWEVLFILINAYNLTILILEQRKVYLSDDQQRLHEQVFSSLTPREMLTLLKSAQWKEAVAGEILITKGVVIDELQLIFHGTVNVEVNGEVVTQISGGGFVGEMSYVTGQPTSANVVAANLTRYLVWPRDKLEKLYSQNSAIKSVMQDVLSCDMAKKLRQ
jgi:hypothetical protein